MATTSTSRPSGPARPPLEPPRRRRRWPWVAALASLAVAVLGVGAALVWFFDDDAPPAVSLEAATAGLASSTTAEPATTTTEAATATTTGTATPTTATAAPASAIAGTWAVDNTSGTFDYESASGSFAGFRIAEELAGVGSTTAVGRTGEVSGTITIDDTTLTAAQIEVDMATITTNESRRDDRALEALEVDTFPTATFVLTQPIDLGDEAASGAPISVEATGDLTIHGVTRSVQLPLQAQLSGQTVVVVGSLEITFADYGVELPSSQIVLSLDDRGIVEMQLLFTRQ